MTASPPDARLARLRGRLERADQAHLLRFYDELSDDERSRLLDQIEAIDWETIPDLVRTIVLHPPDPGDLGTLEPAPYLPRDAEGQWDRDAARHEGERLLRQGRVACFTVAGGQGTRLGYDGPKGCFPAGPVTGKSLFAIFAEGILGTQRKFGGLVPWYIMTSPLNDEATRAFFREHEFFGLDPDQVRFFPQGVMPSFDAKTGNILLAHKHEVATNPDGHGGAFRALVESGATQDMRTRGVEHISYFQVDNPLVRVCDPVFLGLHASSEASSGEMSSKMLPKRDPDERVGVFCLRNGRVAMIEYSDLPEHLARRRNPDGSLAFGAGNPAIHALSVDFVERVHRDPAMALPFHRAVKKVPCVDLESGERIEPAAPNGVKLERFVFDALPLAHRSLILETERVEEFGPIKNAEGEDSPASSARLQSERAARWLESVGVRVPRRPDGSVDATIEISPLTAMGPEDLADRTDLPREIERGARVAL